MRQVRSSRATVYALLVLVLSCVFALACMAPGMGSAWADDASESAAASYEQQAPGAGDDGEQEGDGDAVTPGAPDASGDTEQPSAPGDGAVSPDPGQPAEPDAPATGDPDQPAAPAPGEPAQPDAPATPDNSTGAGSDQPSAPGDGAAAGTDKPAEGDGSSADKPAEKDDAADKPAGDTEADAVAPVAPAELVNFAYASHAAPALGDKVPLAIALQDENAQPAKGVLTVRGALGDVTFESTRTDGRFLVFDLATESLGVGQAQLVQLEVTFADGSRSVVDFLVDAAAYVIEVAQEASVPADAEGAPDAADPTAAQETSAQDASGKMNLPVDARLWLFQKDEAAKVFDGPAIEIEQAVAEKLLALGFGEFEVVPAPIEPNTLSTEPYLYKDTPANEWYVTEGWLDSDGFYWLYAKVTDPEGHQSYAGTRVKVISGDSVYVYNKIRNLTSPTEWLLAVDTESCLVGVYYKMPYGWEEGALWLCSPGTYYTPTVTGLFSVGSRGYYFDSYGVRCYYWTQFYGDYLFHSTTYSTNGSPIDTRLGMHLSHGCVRLEISNARWIYETIPSGTTVLVY